MFILMACDGIDFCCFDIECNNDFWFVYIGFIYGYYLIVVFVFKIIYVWLFGYYR